MIYKALVTAVAVAVCCFNSQTSDAWQRKISVEAEFVPETAVPGQEVTLNLHVEVPDGYHIYGSKNDIKPTEIEFADSELVASGEPAIPPGRINYSDGHVAYWIEGEAVLSQQFTVPETENGSVNLTGNVGYLMCNETGCLPPAKVEFTASLAIESHGDEATGDHSPTAEPFRSEELAAPRPMTNQHGPIGSSDRFAAPTLADIDGDGTLDLLVGNFGTDCEEFSMPADDESDPDSDEQMSIGSAARVKFHRGEHHDKNMELVFGEGDYLKSTDGSFVVTPTW